ncbi:MAG: YaiI/YqxD family protein [bacterium]|nr:YaiI/YqxD family protein [bacterium]
MVIYIDADACPVKNETYKVAARYSIPVCVVANSWMRIPEGGQVSLQVVEGDFDAADDWIAEQAGPGDIVITGDILLAARCVEAGARVLGTRGREFTEAGIGEAVAMRALKDELRQMGEIRHGPPPMNRKARSRFLSTLDQIVNSILNENP